MCHQALVSLIQPHRPARRPATAGRQPAGVVHPVTRGWRLADDEARTGIGREVSQTGSTRRADTGHVHDAR